MIVLVDTVHTARATDSVIRVEGTVEGTEERVVFGAEHRLAAAIHTAEKPVACHVEGWQVLDRWGQVIL